MRSPSPYADPPGAPCGGALYAVRYRDVRGQSVTTWFRLSGAAERFAARVADRGGRPATDQAQVGRWTS